MIMNTIESLCMQRWSSSYTAISDDLFLRLYVLEAERIIAYRIGEAGKDSSQRMDLRVGYNYRLGRKIGSGAFGDIYIGTDISTCIDSMDWK